MSIRTVKSTVAECFKRRVEDRVDTIGRDTWTGVQVTSDDCLMTTGLQHEFLDLLKICLLCSHVGGVSCYHKTDKKKAILAINNFSNVVSSKANDNG